MTPAVPDHLFGLWRRLWLRAPGIEDRTTRVLWFQGPEVFVDLRIPADLPDFTGLTALADLDAATLTAVSRAEGFAGTTRVVADICTWTRTINAQGPESAADVGALSLTPEGLLETGIHADYSELWHHDLDDPPRTRALVDAEGRRAFLVWTATHFSLARGRPSAMTGRPLSEVLADALAGTDRALLFELFDMEFSHGRLDDGDPRITLSTDPARNGDTPFEIGALDRAGLPIAERDFTGRLCHIRWTDIS